MFILICKLTDLVPYEFIAFSGVQTISFGYWDNKESTVGSYNTKGHSAE